MESESFQLLRQSLCEAEVEYLQQNEGTSALQEIVWAIDKLYDIENTEREEGKDTTSIRALIRSSEERLQSLIDGPTLTETGNSELKVWAEDLSSTLRFLDPCQLSFDSSLNPSCSMGSESQSRKNSHRSNFLTILKRDSIFLKQLEQGSQEKLKRVSKLTLIVWTSAVVATVIAVGFLTLDFAVSQRNPMLIVEDIASNSLDFPATSICSNVAGLPSFETFPNGSFPGHPLFAVTEFRLARSMNGPPENLTYPQTVPEMSMGLLETVYVGGDLDRCQSETMQMSVSRQRQALFKYTPSRPENATSALSHLPGCRKCFRFGGQIPQTLIDQGSLRVGPSISLTVAFSSVYRACSFAPRYLNSHIAINFLMTEIRKYSPDLESKGVLDFHAVESKAAALEKLSNGPDALRNLCNIYFFSGYFYPSDDDNMIKFIFDVNSSLWQSSGTSLFSTRTWKPNDPYKFGADPEGIYKNVYFTTGPEIYFENPQEAIRSRIVDENLSGVVVELDSKSTMLLTRSQNDENKIGYDVEHHMSPSQSIVDAQHPFEYFDFELDYKKFVTSQATLKPAMSWSEYVTDIFEFLGLFTGICIFSLIVAPAQTLV